MIRSIAVAAAVATLALAPSAAQAASKFGFMFPGLRPLNSQTNQQLADLAQSQLDPAADTENNVGVTSGFTYFGQFIDHDLTLDTLPQPNQPVDPTTLTNGRTFRFDLDSVYGGGPDVSPQLYEADKTHFLVQETNVNGVRDLARNPDGSAILVEHRNDENEIISQLHLAILKLHNRFVDDGADFNEARRMVVDNYQWVVVHDYLPHVVGQGVVNNILRHGTKFYHPRRNNPMTPVEFSVAAFRFGHSQVRASYEVNEDSGKIDVFNLAPGTNDLRGGRELPATNQIGWGNFFTQLTVPGDEDGVNLSRKIDPLISNSLFQLPIPGAEATGSNVLAFRNMLRAKFYNMASGQRVARAMGINKVYSPRELNLGPGFENGTPLWYYILAESQSRTGGARLGPVGARIDAEVFLKLLDIDNHSILHNGFEPDPEIAGSDGELTISDLLVHAGVAEEPAPEQVTPVTPMGVTP